MHSPQRRLEFWRALEEQEARQLAEAAHVSPQPPGPPEAGQSDAQLRLELGEILMQALRTGADAAHLVQRAIGPDLVRLGLLAPDVQLHRAE